MAGDLEERVSRLEAALHKATAEKLEPLIEARRQHRRAILHAFDAGVTQKDIAAALGVTPSAVSAQMRKAVREEFLTEDGVSIRNFFNKLYEIVDIYTEKLADKRELAGMLKLLDAIEGLKPPGKDA